MELVLARHGETDWNVEEVFRGRLDVALNDTGTRQAELLGEYLSGEKIDAVYSSPLKRALKTAAIVANYHKIRVQVVPELIDLDFGDWQGLSVTKVKEKYHELYHEWANHPERVRVPGGESLEDVTRRAMGLVDQVLRKYPGRVVLVSHRVIHKVLICALLGLDNSHFWNVKMDTCGITRFTCENGRFVLTGHNDTSFLKTLEKAPLGDF